MKTSSPPPSQGHQSTTVADATEEVTAGQSGVSYRPIGPSDLLPLRTFSCGVRPVPYVAVVEEMIRDYLPLSIAAGRIVALGAYASNGELLGLAAWMTQGADCHCNIVAVTAGRHRRNGIGRELVGHVMDVSRRAGCRAVVMRIHWDNQPMFGLVEDIDRISIRRVPGDDDYALCVIPLS